jgi:hypothetical protein
MLAIISTLLAAASLASGQTQLTAKQRKQLLGLGPNVVVAGYLPSGYHIAKVRFDPGDANAAGAYEIDYAGPSGASFVVQMASDGIGDLILQAQNGDEATPTATKTIRTTLFPEGNLEFLDKGKDHRFVMQWVDFGEKSKPRFLSAMGDHLSMAVSLRLVQGLRRLR